MRHLKYVQNFTVNKNFTRKNFIISVYQHKEKTVTAVFNYLKKTFITTVTE